MKNIIKILNIVAIIIVFAHSGCKKAPGILVFNSSDILDITFTKVIFASDIRHDGGSSVTERGFCWNTSGKPVVTDEHIKEGAGTGAYTSEVSSLSIGATYYMRPYAINGDGIFYGEEIMFTNIGVTITTSNATNITTNSAQCGGNITDDGGAEIIHRGVCWSTSQNPTISDAHTVDGNGMGSFASKMNNLKNGTTYFVRAYLTNEYGTYYGDSKKIITNGIINGHEYVDLGLPSGLKWATCNVGADSPEKYGDYFAWGETETNGGYYYNSNCITSGKSINQLRNAGIIDANNHLTSKYDAARANWGGGWRMPTEEEMQELVDECTWQWTTQGGKNGYRVTGPNGNSIFLPAAGIRSGSSLFYAGEYGYYWSSTPYESNSSYAYLLFFKSDNHYVGWYDRYYGQSVRPVSE